MYGAACYRRNLQHWLEFDHPPSHPLLVSPGLAVADGTEDVIELSSDDEPPVESESKRPRRDDDVSARASSSTSGSTGAELLASLREEREARQAQSQARGNDASAPPPPSLGFHLMTLHRVWVDAGLAPPSANERTVGLEDLLGAPALQGATELHLHNYMIDMVQRQNSNCGTLAPLPCVPYLPCLAELLTRRSSE